MCQRHNSSKVELKGAKSVAQKAEPRGSQLELELAGQMAEKTVESLAV
jgi:hypothetical protein